MIDSTLEHGFKFLQSWENALQGDIYIMVWVGKVIHLPMARRHHAPEMNAKRVARDTCILK